MIDAEKARELAGVDEVATILDHILLDVEQSAKAKSRYLIVRDFGFGTDYLYDKSQNKRCDEVILRLRRLGFQTKFENPCVQFDDHYLVISW